MNTICQKNRACPRIFLGMFIRLLAHCAQYSVNSNSEDAWTDADARTTPSTTREGLPITGDPSNNNIMGTPLKMNLFVHLL